MGMDVMKAVRKTMSGVKMTHKQIQANKNAPFAYIRYENGKLIDENGEVLRDAKRYINRGMKSGWEVYKEEKR
ncbi:hypothetical protein BMT55_11725 [Listeria newyorkensis]|uniref:Uncharacterized protein n=2 Tax=Listeria newyorkensis TaxID=1497681 RepID=A0ABX4XKN9_9LIST|nr:hypothetical protein BMT55_11725 [Listeria newyorkensis]